MDIPVKVSNYELELIKGGCEEDHCYPPLIKITGRSNSASVTVFEFISPEGVKYLDWISLSNACFNGTSLSRGCINICKGLVEFTDDGEGTLKISIAAKNCVDAFLDAANITKEWLNETTLTSDEE